jgi:hypothetical protein
MDLEHVRCLISEVSSTELATLAAKVVKYKENSILTFIQNTISIYLYQLPTEQ